jgi:hypothetical protein
MPLQLVRLLGALALSRAGVALPLCTYDYYLLLYRLFEKRFLSAMLRFKKQAVYSADLIKRATAMHALMSLYACDRGLIAYQQLVQVLAVSILALLLEFYKAGVFHHYRSRLHC